MRRARAATLGCSFNGFFELCDLFSSLRYHALDTAGRETTAWFCPDAELRKGVCSGANYSTQQACAPLLLPHGLFPALQQCRKFCRHLFWLQAAGQYGEGVLIPIFFPAVTHPPENYFNEN